jgi:hypothetical protein
LRADVSDHGGVSCVSKDFEDLKPFRFLVLGVEELTVAEDGGEIPRL